MNCPRCQSPLEDPSAKFCPLCGSSVLPPPPATTRSPEPAPEPTPTPAAPLPPEPVFSTGERPGAADAAAGPGTSAHCAVHVERTAVDICSRCGAFACRECLVIGADGQGVCSACLARQGGETGPLPWEKRGELGFFKAYWETTKNIMFNPNTAFDRLEPETGRWWDPLSYAILSNFLGLSGTMVVYGFAAAFGAIGAMASKSSSGSDLGTAAVVGIVLGIILMFLIFVPLGAVMTAFILSGMEHLSLKIVGVAVRPFEATLRTYCYAQAPMFWGVVPVCGAYAYPIWQMVCRIFGYKTVHKTTGGKATAGVLLPSGLCCGVFALFYGAIIAASIASGH